MCQTDAVEATNPNNRRWKERDSVFATEFARQRVINNEGFATKAFQYELSDFPPAVLHNSQMRKASKHKFH